MAEINTWLAERRLAGHAPPPVAERTVAEVLADEQPRLMHNPRPFDRYLEQPVRVSATALAHF